MARKTTAKRATGKPQASPAKLGDQSPATSGDQSPATSGDQARAKPVGQARAKIRMYRLGVGDCFLLRFPRPDNAGDLRILIDCGVHQSQPQGPDRMAEVVEDLHAVTGGALDLVIATHEHYDHLSGFGLLLQKFGERTVKKIWAPWCQNGDDAFARELQTRKDRAMTALSGANARLQLTGDAKRIAQLGSVLGFFGDDAGVKLKGFGDALRKLGPDNIEYLQPGQLPIELVEDQVRAFVLGPPRNKQLLKRADASKTDKDAVYNFGSAMGALEQIEPALEREAKRPFDNRFALPLEGTKALSFFQQRYWAPVGEADPAAALAKAHTEGGQDDKHGIDIGQDWRRIDGDWLDSATTLAMKLDVETNNTSLVIAFELGPKREGGPVLLFAADAQVGNWQSWQDVKWPFQGREVSGPDLLKRTIVYKVGHHASENATLKKQGLELMEALEMALVPTDAEMAKKVRWGTLPGTRLLERLDEVTREHVIRTDEPGGGGKSLPTLEVMENDLFYEIEIQAG